MASFSLSALLFFTFLCYSQANLINDICSKATNPSLCNQVFQSDPRSPQADLRGLGQIIIEKSTVAAKDVISVSKSFPGKATEVCVETCTYTVHSLEKCSGLLKECGGGPRCKGDAVNEGSAAYANVDTCEDAFKEVGAEPAPLQTAAKRAKDLIDVFLVIGNKL